MSCNPQFWSEDGTFGLRIESQILQNILDECEQSASNETGGILVGHYSDNLSCAVITQQSGKPDDSWSGRSWFSRGTAGLQKWLDRLWNANERRYYLGEWHYHPGGAPEPSATDRNQMTQIARDTSYKCPEPVLLIVGGTATDPSYLRAFVFMESHNSPLELFSCQNVTEEEVE